MAGAVLYLLRGTNPLPTMGATVFEAALAPSSHGPFTQPCVTTPSPGKMAMHTTAVGVAVPEGTTCMRNICFLAVLIIVFNVTIS